MSQLPEDRRAPIGALADLLARLGGLLLEYGCPTHRIEDALSLSAESHGYSAQVFSTPTGLWMALHEEAGAAPHIRLVRVSQWSTDLERLDALDEVFNAVADGACSVAEGHARLDEIVARAPRYPKWAAVLAGGLASGAAAVFFGGGLLTVFCGGVLGAAVIAMVQLLGRSKRTRLLIDFTIGLMTGLTAWLVSWMDPSLPRKPLILAGIIVAVPGMSLTAALGELAEKNMVSGTARLMDSAMVMVSLVLGVVFVATLERSLIGAPVTVNAAPSALWALLLATLVAAGAFAVLFNVPRDTIPLAVGAVVCAWAAAYGAEQLVGGGPAAGFVGALAIGLYANFWARRSGRPTQRLLVPGIVILVPGAFGFVSFEQVLWGNVEQGVAGLVTTIATAGALALGVLLANAALPARKVL